MMDMSDYELVYSYTRKQAIADGVLIDVTKEALESGFKVSTAVTDHLYHRYLIPSPELEKEGQSTRGRLHDLFMMTMAAASVRWNGNRVYFDVLFLTAPRVLKKVRCLAIVGPNDDLSPCLTIMLPEDE